MDEQEPIDPNLNADAYRNLPAAGHPPINDRQLEFVITHPDGSMALGASNMVDRYWNGTVWFYKDLQNFDCTNYTAAIRTQSGVRVATFLEKYNKFITGEDSGLMQVFEFDSKVMSETQDLRCVGYMCQHDDSITCISTFSNNTSIVTSGMDASIKLWDTAEMTATLSYNQAQTDIVTSVQVQNESRAVFLSTSLDSEALLWDTRKTKPALGLLKKNSSGLTSASWKPKDDNIVAVGGDDGCISILDVRKPRCVPVYEFNQFIRGVHKIIFNPDCSTQLAGCSDSTEIKVFDLFANCKNIFENNRHKDFVRDLAWYRNEIISCSWDNTILKHTL